MYCKKCGSKIPDDSVFCMKCGAEVGQIEDSKECENSIKDNFEVDTQKEDESLISNSTGQINDVKDSSITKNDKSKKNAIIVVIVIITFIVIAIAITSKPKCKKDSCTKTVTENSNYCIDHTCKEPGCNNAVSLGDEYCYAHTIDMRNKLTNSSFRFDLNSVGGIEFDFYAKNSTGKEIKYVDFNVYLTNAVGDSVRDEITGSSSCGVEIVGPIAPEGRVSVINETIGYCETVKEISIPEITIIYTDGTRETGDFNYYYKRY